MNKIISSLYNLTKIDSDSKGTSAIHLTNPVVKLLLIVLYTISVVSYDNYQISSLIPFAVIAYLILIYSNINITSALKKVLFLELFIIAFALWNSLFSAHYVNILNFYIHGGIITFLSIIIKYSLSMLVVTIFIATTSLTNIINAMNFIKIPKLFTTIFFLIYRYIWILIEEIFFTTLAVDMRRKTNSGINFKMWGSLVGQIFIRTYERGIIVYDAMCLRGFDLNISTNHSKLNLKYKDYLILLSGIFLIGIIRIINVTEIIGRLALYSFSQ